MTGDVREGRDVGVMALPTMPIAAANPRGGDTHERGVRRAGRSGNVHDARHGLEGLVNHGTHGPPSIRGARDELLRLAASLRHG